MARDDPFRPRMRGAGGGGKGGSGSTTHAPQEAPNTLQSKAIVKLLELISEGPIKGFPADNVAKCVVLNAGSPDNTPLMASDGTWNFAGASVDYRLGLPSQTPITGFTEQATPVNVNAQVTHGGDPVSHAVVRRIADVNTTAVKVITQLAALFKVDQANGNMNGYTVQYHIDVKANANAVNPTNAELK